MSLIEPYWITLRDGARLFVRSPEFNDAQTILDYLDEVRRETDGIMFAPEDKLPTLEKERQWIDGRRGDPNDLHLTAWSGEGLVSVCGLQASSRYREQHNAALGISVRRAWHNRGVGTALMQTMLAWAQAHPVIELVTLSVFADNPGAIHVYERAGFACDGVGSRYARRGPGVYIDVVFMSRWVGEVGAP